eukprot:Gb_29396 [translate_table: standard]
MKVPKAKDARSADRAQVVIGCNNLLALGENPDPMMYPKAVAAKRNERHILALVLKAMGERITKMKEINKIIVQNQISFLEKGEGFGMGYAGVISVFTIFLAIIVVQSVTQSDAAQPPTLRASSLKHLHCDERTHNNKVSPLLELISMLWSCPSEEGSLSTFGASLSLIGIVGGSVFSYK